MPEPKEFSVKNQPIDICPACGELGLKADNSFELGDRRKGLKGTWTLVACESCGVICMSPMPTEAQLGEYYAAYSNDENVDLSLKAGSRSPALRKFFHRLTGDVDPRDFVEVSAGARILDYGCGHAGYLSDFHQRGFSISGAEIASYVVQTCQQHGFDVHQVEDFSKIPFADGEFDIVYLMQVFEHLREPHMFLDELARVLKSGGTLYLAVPNANSIWRKVFGNNWVSGWFAPYHLFHYNRDSLASLADRHGFDVVSSWSDTPESWFRLNLKAAILQNEHRLDWRRHWLDSRLARFVLMIFLRLFELPVRERDCLVVKFRKRLSAGPIRGESMS